MITEIVEALVKAGATPEIILEAVRAAEKFSNADWSGQRKSIPSKVREFVYTRDGLSCSYCGTTQGPFEIDHVVPWSRGGGNEPENLRVSCRSCNRQKYNRDPLEMGWKR